MSVGEIESEAPAYQPFVSAVSKIGEAVYLGDPDVVMGLLRDLLVDTIERWSTDEAFSEQEKQQRAFADSHQIGELVEAFLGKDAGDYMPMPAWNEPGFIDAWIRSAVPEIEDQSPEDTIETALRLFLFDAWSVVDRWTKPGVDESDVQNAITIVLQSWTEAFLGIDSAALAESEGEVFDPLEMSDEELAALADGVAPDETTLADQQQPGHKSYAPLGAIEKSFRGVNSVYKTLGELFDENEHPRGDEGKFAKKGSGKAAKKSKAKTIPDAPKVADVIGKTPPIADEDRKAFVESVSTPMSGPIKLDSKAVKDFHKTGDIESFVKALDTKGGRENYIGSVRAAAAYAERHGGIDVAKSPVLREVRDKSMQVASELGDKVTNAIQHYTTDAYGPLNAALRSGKQMPDRGKEMVDAVTKAVDEVGEWDNPATVFRGIDCADEGERDRIISMVEKHLKTGKPWEDKGIVSTSASEQMSRDWIAQGSGLGVLFRIKAKSGMLISTFTGLPAQQEIIQKPGTKYKPLKIGEENGMTVIDFEQV